MMGANDSRTAATALTSRRIGGNSARRVQIAFAPVGPGAIVLLVRKPAQMQDVRSVIESIALHGGKVADVPMRRVPSLKAMYGARSRDAEIAQALARFDARAHEIGERLSFVRLSDCRRFSALSNEGVHVVLDHLAEHGCVTAEQTISSGARDDTVDSLVRLDAGAKEKKGIVFLFVHCLDDADAMWMGDYCSELIVADECEPGPGASVAFSLAAMSLYSQHSKGIGRTMCEIVEQDGRRKQRHAAFIAATAQDRAMWYLKRERESLSFIAELMDINKATVMRRLKSLPLPPDIDANLDPPEGWRDEWFEFLGLEFEEEPEDESNEEVPSHASTRHGTVRL